MIDMLSLFSDPHVWASLITLTVMEIVLGVDNIIFLSLIVGNLPQAQQANARRFGLALALILRVALLFAITLIIQLKQPVLSLYGFDFSWRDIILIAGGLFLLFKATQEIHKEVEEDREANKPTAYHALMLVILQIAVIDMVFSIDSIITAIGIAEHVEIMIIAVVISILVMYVASEVISHFIDRHPTIKMLALSFLFLIGAVLIADGLGFHVPRGYIYFAMGFATLVELFNTLVRRNKRKTQRSS